MVACNLCNVKVSKGRIIRILTSTFPRYFAVLTRVREQVFTSQHWTGLHCTGQVRAVGPEGGKVALLQEPRLRATFPKNALYKRIKVTVVHTVRHLTLLPIVSRWGCRSAH